MVGVNSDLTKADDNGLCGLWSSNYGAPIEEEDIWVCLGERESAARISERKKKKQKRKLGVSAARERRCATKKKREGVQNRVFKPFFK